MKVMNINKDSIMKELLNNVFNSTQSNYMAAIKAIESLNILCDTQGQIFRDIKSFKVKLEEIITIQALESLNIVDAIEICDLAFIDMLMDDSKNSGVLPTLYDPFIADIVEEFNKYFEKIKISQ